MAKKNVRLRTPKFRVSYPYVFDPQINKNNGKEEWTIEMIFDRENFSDNDKALWKEMQKQAKNLAKETFGEESPDKLWKKNFKTNEDHDLSKRPELKGMVTVKAKTKYGQPDVVDASAQPIFDRQDFYAGCYAHCSVELYAYNKPENKGVAFGLGNIQKLAEGEPFGAAKIKAADEFTPLDTSELADLDDDEDNVLL